MSPRQSDASGWECGASILLAFILEMHRRDAYATTAGNVLSGLTPTKSGQVKRINKDAEMISVSDGASLDAAVGKLGE
jgi:hypothetical protein